MVVPKYVVDMVTNGNNEAGRKVLLASVHVMENYSSASIHVELRKIVASKLVQAAAVQPEFEFQNGKCASRRFELMP